MKKIKKLWAGKARPTGKGSMAIGIAGLVLRLLLLFALGIFAVLGGGSLGSGLLGIVILVLHSAHLAFGMVSLHGFSRYIQKLSQIRDTHREHSMV